MSRYGSATVFVINIVRLNDRFKKNFIVPKRNKTINHGQDTTFYQFIIYQATLCISADRKNDEDFCSLWKSSTVCKYV